MGLLNHLLRGQPWLRERLMPFAGRSVRLEVPPLALVLAISAEGELQPSAAPVADASARLSPLTVMRLAAGEEGARSGIDVSGDAALAAALAGVLRELRWDAAEDLSRLVGDIAAHRLVRLGQGVLAWQRETLSSLLAATSEYLVEERHVLPGREAVASWAREVDALRDDAERLGQRIDQLQRRIDQLQRRIDQPERRSDRPSRGD
ncbi:MAG TPA: SCP2 sterol-binding domain-containing protein [Burkholderiales bacterium]